MPTKSDHEAMRLAVIDGVRVKSEEVHAVDGQEGEKTRASARQGGEEQRSFG